MKYTVVLPEDATQKLAELGAVEDRGPKFEGSVDGREFSALKLTIRHYSEEAATLEVLGEDPKEANKTRVVVAVAMEPKEFWRTYRWIYARLWHEFHE